MGLIYDGSGGVFTRLGAVGGIVTANQTFRATTLPAAFEAAMDEFDASDMVIRSIIKGLPDALAAAQQSLSGVSAAARTAAQNTLVEMVNADDPQAARTVVEALAELIRQMIADTETIEENVVGLSLTPGASNVGDGVLVGSVLNGSGQSLQYALAEDVEFVVTSTTTAGAEQWRGRGEAAVADKLSHLWPAGSGSTAAYTSLAPTAGGNKVTNGGFETFTVTDLPDGWTALVGTVTTHFGEESSLVYSGSKAFRHLGNGSTLTSLAFTLTQSQLAPRTPLAFNMYHRVSAAAAAGAAAIELVDGSNTIIADEEGNNNAIVVDLTALTTSYEAVNGVFRLPDPLPAVVKLRIRQTTALENTKNWIMDHLALQAMTRQYANGGPYFAFFSGATPWSGDDLYTAAVANNYAGKFQTAFSRLFDIETTSLVVPYSGTPSIDDALYL